MLPFSLGLTIVRGLVHDYLLPCACRSSQDQGGDKPKVLTWESQRGVGRGNEGNVVPEGGDLPLLPDLNGVQQPLLLSLPLQPSAAMVLSPHYQPRTSFCPVILGLKQKHRLEQRGLEPRFPLSHHQDLGQVSEPLCASVCQTGNKQHFPHGFQ